MKFLIQSSECYRVDSQNEVDALIEECKHDSSYALAKYSCVQRERKEKGEVTDSWYRVTVIKNFNEEKDPDTVIDVKYEVN